MTLLNLKTNAVIIVRLKAIQKKKSSYYLSTYHWSSSQMFQTTFSTKYIYIRFLRSQICLNNLNSHLLTFLLNLLPKPVWQNRNCHCLLLPLGLSNTKELYLLCLTNCAFYYPYGNSKELRFCINQKDFLL